MRSEEEGKGEPGADESSRLETLGKGVTRRPLLVVGLMLVLTCMALVGLALGVLGHFSKQAQASSVEALQVQVESLAQQLTTLQAQLAQQDRERAARQAERLGEIFRPSEDPGSAAQVARTLVGQEQGFQQLVAGLKLGMRDLAAMLPGSRSWLVQYNEALDQSLAGSQARIDEVQAWAAGRVEEKLAQPPAQPLAQPPGPKPAPATAQ
ncbi:MAG: hypothetical protein V4812_14825 [Pseudomonadota bacterium]